MPAEARCFLGTYMGTLAATFCSRKYNHLSVTELSWSLKS